MSIDPRPTGSAIGDVPPADAEARFRVPDRKVAADVVDDEVVIVDLESGSYYTTQGAGCDAWRLFAAGASIGETIEVLRARYSSGEDIPEYVAAMLAVLTGRGLLEPAAEPTAAELDLGAVQGTLAPISEPRPFAPAEFVDFDDMRSLLLLDPVHDVDDRGWPHAAPGV